MLRSLAALTFTVAFAAPLQAEDLAEFSTQDLPGSKGVVVRLRHPAAWRKVQPDDEMALAELRGPQGPVTGLLQLARGRPGAALQALCAPERARTMLQHLGDDETDARITDVFARTTEGRPGFEFRYERKVEAEHLLVRSVIVCLKDSRLLVSCGASGTSKAAVAEIEPVCRQVIDSLSIAED